MLTVSNPQSGSRYRSRSIATSQYKCRLSGSSRPQSIRCWLSERPAIADNIRSNHSPEACRIIEAAPGCSYLTLGYTADLFGSLSFVRRSRAELHEKAFLRIVESRAPSSSTIGARGCAFSRHFRPINRLSRDLLETGAAASLSRK